MRLERQGTFRARKLISRDTQRVEIESKDGATVEVCLRGLKDFADSDSTYDYWLTIRPDEMVRIIRAACDEAADTIARQAIAQQAGAPKLLSSLLYLSLKVAERAEGEGHG
jgi:hypothetical protein